MNKNINCKCSADADKIQNQIYQHMTYAEKWDEVLKLRETAWMMKSAAVREAHPDWSDAQVERAVRDIFLYAAS
ncbi:MAG: hypothetical protein JW774_09920 [Candidatus Aureabacteria bacterium]|nr:hypothetical protein [Candidatus Auribacterota bacterium]